MLFTSFRGQSRSAGFTKFASLSLFSIGVLVSGACSAPPSGADSDSDSGTGDGDGDGDICLTNCHGDGDGDGDFKLPGDGDGDRPTGNYCDEFEVNFEPQTPTVYVMVDASSSMSELGFWEPMKTGVLNVVNQLTADVRFGFGSYTGTSAACTGLTNATPSISTDNYQQIADAYNAIPAPPISMGADKQETPTPTAIAQATEILLADESPGDRYILLVSDGEPDFCNDNTANCAVDGTVAAMQYAFQQGVRTLVFAIDSASIQNPQYFNYFAQAGAGELPNWSIGLTVTSYNGAVVDQCNTSEVAAQWGALRTNNGNAPNPTGCSPLPSEGNPECFLPAGDYSASGGTTQAILSTSPEALAEAILSSVSGLKSCTLELNFDVVNAAAGEIFVHDMQTPIPQDQWQMNSSYVLELLGDACLLWQSAEVKDFFAGFPCAAVVVR